MSKSYQHVEAGASVLWTITHNLGLTTPIVDVMVDVTGTLTKIIPKDIRVVNSNVVEIDFTIPYLGECRIL